MADDVVKKQTTLEWIGSKLFPPVPGAAQKSTEQRQRVQGQKPSKEDVAAGIEEVPKAEGKSNYQGAPRQKYYR